MKEPDSEAPLIAPLTDRPFFDTPSEVRRREFEPEDLGFGCVIWLFLAVVGIILIIQPKDESASHSAHGPHDHERIDDHPAKRPLSGRH
jgi:hypothetical protein